MEKPATILIVDDDAALRMLFERCLIVFGYRPMLAADGITALRIAGEAPEIRLIMLDVVMPGLSGQRLAEQLRALLPRAAILFCSGHFTAGLTRLGIDLEEAHFMQKPCRPVELKQRLAEILAAR